MTEYLELKETTNQGGDAESSKWVMISRKVIDNNQWVGGIQIPALLFFAMCKQFATADSVEGIVAVQVK